jgi:hypothetical protein
MQIQLGFIDIIQVWGGGEGEGCCMQETKCGVLWGTKHALDFNNVRERREKTLDFNKPDREVHIMA